MSRRRFHAPPAAFSPDGGRVALSREETQHLAGALRLAAGQEVYVFDGEGREFLCAVAEGAGRGAAGATLEVLARVEPLCAESPLELTLCVALLKGEKFDLVVQKATELGVARVVPVETARADVKLARGEGARKRVERWRRIAVEAAKQSGRARVPQVAGPSSLTDVLAEDSPGAAEAKSRRLMFAERGGRSLVGAAGAWAEKPSRIAALIGPEGGWEEAERERATAAGWEAITLGGRVMRAETAGIVVAALLQHLCGDLA
ncbi:MAG TPA: 16S rRNA (uracil(1498)-N(3))-methyltransferase [Pyrinomonadaceae bacterium]|jgi:16S rRNA (uracil1498-N3)-methyltransferase